jgi:hypothetical protein
MLQLTLVNWMDLVTSETRWFYSLLKTSKLRRLIGNEVIFVDDVLVVEEKGFQWRCLP